MNQLCYLETLEGMSSMIVSYLFSVEHKDDPCIFVLLFTDLAFIYTKKKFDSNYLLHYTKKTAKTNF